MAKFEVLRRYPFLRKIAGDLTDRVRALEREQGLLRKRLIEAQKEKAAALNQAEELRREKERLRAKVAGLNHELNLRNNMIRDLNAKIGDLMEENRQLQEPKR